MARKIEVEIIGDASKLQRELNSAGKSTTSFGSSLKSMSKMAAIGAGAAGLGALVVGLKSTLGAAKDAEQAQSRLMSALDSANVSYAKHGDAIDDAIQKTSRLAAIDDEDLSDAFAKIVRSTGDVTKATEGMALAADIARARNISLETATGAVEKAFIGQTRGLKSVGVELTKGMTATEALAKAQEQFAGAAAKHGETAAAAQEKLAVSMENLQETIGQKLLPVFEDLMVKLNEAVVWVEVNWPRIEETFNNGMEKVRAIFALIEPILSKWIKAFEGMVRLVAALINGEWGKAWDALKMMVSNTLGAIVQMVLAAPTLLGKAMLALGQKAAESFMDGIKALPGLLRDAIVGYIGLIVGMYGRMASAALGLGKSFVSGLASGLSGAAGAVASGVSTAVKAAINFIIGQINSALSFTIPLPFGKSITVDAPDIPYLAKGVQNFRGGLAVVGERGPELVNLPRGSDVIPNGRGAGGLVVNFNGPVYGANSRELALSVRDELQRMGRWNSGGMLPGAA